MKNIVIYIIVFIILYYLFKKQNIEPFLWDLKWVGDTTDDCYKHGVHNCLKYSNCGVCLKDGKLNCIPGDEKGPFFKEDCLGWFHNNRYDRYIFNEGVIRGMPPWSMFYPDYEARYPSPTIRSMLI